jgi:mono/diheme cytochrome c family protein
MRDRAKEGKRRSLVPALKDCLTFFWLLLSFSVACDQRGKARTEWRPEDHQPPPVEMPEGQGAAEESGDPTASAAKALWSMRCAQCHGEEGRGDGPGRPPAAQLPDLTNAAFHDKRSNSELYQVIEKGRNMMPAFGSEITRQGIDALIGHVRTLRAEK